MRRPFLLALLALPLAVIACGDDAASSSSTDGPVIAASTALLGDVVSHVVGDLAEVEVILPPGANPHDAQASPRQVAAMRSADALVVNGGDLEESLLPNIEAASDAGVPTIAALDGITPLTSDSDGDSDHNGDSDHDGDGHGHAHGDVNAHFFTDPMRMAEAVEWLADQIADAVPELDREALEQQADAYVDELQALDRDVRALVARLPDDRRKLVMDHHVFDHFADRYGFELVGAVIPSVSTQAEASARQLRDLAKLIEDAEVPAIFVDASSSPRLADTVAAEAEQPVDVVPLYTEALGPKGSGAETYVDMVRTNAERIVDALG